MPGKVKEKAAKNISKLHLQRDLEETRKNLLNQIGKVFEAIGMV